jgi:hypothetical protein
MLCALRSVGTYPSSGIAGVVPRGSPPVREVRANMKDAALGDDGFNIPSLLGAASSAPYFHAGNARTFEALFDEAFVEHHRALSPQFLSNASDRAAAVRQLTAFLLSIDDETPVMLVPTTLGYDPDLCKQY